jgi:hypothetical protein
MDETEGPFLLVRVGGDELPLDIDDADQLSRWLDESARTASAETVETVRGLSLKILQAVTNGVESIDLTGEERTALLATKLPYMAGPTLLGNLLVSLRAARRAESARPSAGD